jgi:broad specificity phosphatase PhoE
VNKHHLILVKHSLPEIIPGIPANQWRLSQDGRALCGPLSEKLAAFRPEALYSSFEPKAIETAELTAPALGLKNQSLPGLNEHLRETVGFMNSKADFQAAVAHFFKQPAEITFGEESANQAQERFCSAVDKLLAAHPDQTIAVVAHGTVITLFVALYNSVDLYSFWKRLTLPSFIVFSRPSYKLTDTVLFPS